MPSAASAVPRDFLRELHAGGESEFGVDVGGPEQPGCFTVTAGADGEYGEALESVGSGAECPNADGSCERVVRWRLWALRGCLRRGDRHLAPAILQGGREADRSRLAACGRR